MRSAYSPIRFGIAWYPDNMSPPLVGTAVSEPTVADIASDVPGVDPQPIHSHSTATPEPVRNRSGAGPEPIPSRSTAVPKPKPAAPEAALAPSNLPNSLGQLQQLRLPIRPLPRPPRRVRAGLPG